MTMGDFRPYQQSENTTQTMMTSQINRTGQGHRTKIQGYKRVVILNSKNPKQVQALNTVNNTSL